MKKINVRELALEALEKLEQNQAYSFIRFFPAGCSSVIKRAVLFPDATTMPFCSVRMTVPGAASVFAATFSEAHTLIF